MHDIFKGKKGIAVITDEERIVSYDGLEMMCNAFLEHISFRSLIIILCSNTLGSLSGYLGCMKGGHVPLLLNENIELIILEKYIKKYKPAYIWMKKTFQCARLKESGDFYAAFEMEEFVLLRTMYPIQEINDELALLLTTSGTTGNMKTVRMSGENLKANTESICAYMGIKWQHRAITTLPMNYTFGLSVINTHLYMGATVLLTERTIMDRRFWQFFKKYSATFFAGVPYTYELLRKIGPDKMKLESLQIMAQAGGNLGEAEWEYFSEYAEQNRCKFFVMYGQTEATARISYLSPGEMNQKTGSIGKAVPGGKLYLVDERGEQIKEADTGGQIVYQGANVMMGYAENNQDLSLGDTQGNTLLTGDIGYFDTDGYFYITGRLSRFAKICGKRINLDDVEKYILEVFGHSMICVDIEGRIHVFYRENNTDEEALKEMLCQVYGIGKRNVKVIQVQEFPYRSSGKIDYQSLVGGYA